MLGTMERRRMALAPKGERWCPRCNREEVRAEGRRVCVDCHVAEQRLNEYWRHVAGVTGPSRKCDQKCCMDGFSRMKS